MVYNGDNPSQDIFYGQKVVFSGRQIPNVLALVKKQDPKPIPAPDTGDNAEQLRARIAELEKENLELRSSKVELLNRIDHAVMILEGEEQ